MPTVITTPGPTAVQMSGKDPAGRWILSAICTRTYSLAADGTCTVAAEQKPLVGEPVFDGDLLLADTDFFPWKLRTDLVVVGHAYGRGKSSFDAAVAVDGKVQKRIRVIGDRECAMLSDTEVIVSPPARVDKIPLSYAFAYGGHDAAAEAKYANPVLKKAGLSMADVDPRSASTFTYLRNPAGRGFLIEATPEGVAGLKLPNLEDPLDVLTPDRIVVGDPRRWPQQPLPQSLGWFSHDWFPRVSLLGLKFALAEALGEKLPEIARGLAPKELWSPPESNDFAFRFNNGASPGLQLPYLAGNEKLTFENLHPKHPTWTLKLPGHRPKISVDGRKGTLKEAEPAIHTVVVEPDADRATVVWRGAAPALRPYLSEELEKMPFRVEWP